MGLLSGCKTSNSVTLSFKIPYYTQWGQQLLVCGSEPILGAWNVKRGLLLKPSHQGDELIWSGSLAVPAGLSFEYNYYVVDDKKNVLRWEAGKKRKMSLPKGVQNEQLVDLHDLWQTGSDDLPLRSAFKNVIFRRSWTGTIDEKRPELGQDLLDNDDSVVIQFRICCPNIEEDTAICVIGSSSNLGRRKVEDGLKLVCVGESLWLAEIIMKKDEFPIKYRYCKINKDKNLDLETGANRELVVNLSNNQPKYIVCSDGLMRLPGNALEGCRCSYSHVFGQI